MHVPAEANHEQPILHVIRERDVGLFSLVQQVIANVAWARAEDRVPIVDFRDRCCYWTSEGHEGASSVWEYYFEPATPGYPAASVPAAVTQAVEEDYLDQNDLGRFVTADAFVTNHYGDHPALDGIAPAVPYMDANASQSLRRWTSGIIADHVRPRAYIERKADSFFEQELAGREVIGVHVRGTDAVSAQETREYRQGSLSLDRFVEAISAQLKKHPNALVLVATDAQSSFDHLKTALGDRVVGYDALRHLEGEAAGVGPTGMIMPAYISGNSKAAARNGEDAVIEYLLLTRCTHLVHNGAGLALTVLLANPDLPHTNTHALAWKAMT